MLWNVENGNLKLSDTDMDYIRFGSGEKVLVMLPGLGDGLRTVKGTAPTVAVMYRIFSEEYTVYLFSRKNCLTEGCTTRDMARDQKEAMDALGIAEADLFGVSMGGMIAQHFAADYPERVRRLVLAVTSARPNPILTESVEEWMRLAREDDYTALMDSNIRRIYSGAYYRKNRRGIPLLAKLTKPDSFDRFLLQAQACLSHDAFERLPYIQAPTLVIGGEQDQVLGAEASREIAERIPNAQLYLYTDYGHGLYEEAKDFNSRVLAFLGQEIF
ncbi:MAG: alpha/beta fold hydrolase [Faecousia sp.]